MAEVIDCSECECPYYKLVANERGNWDSWCTKADRGIYRDVIVPWCPPTIFGWGFPKWCPLEKDA